MTCPDVEPLLDAFVDSELPPTRLLEVAQHAASCSTCEVAIGELTALRQSVAAWVEQEVDRLDLASVWPAVEATIGRRPAAHARIVPLRRKAWTMPALPAWGAVAAIAAGLLLWVGGPHRHDVTPGTGTVAVPSPGQPVQIAKATRPVRALNHADIDRLSGKDIAVRREPKSGTTIIWVSHQEPR
jgi:anti-sigma factor RsiW